MGSGSATLVSLKQNSSKGNSYNKSMGRHPAFVFTPETELRRRTERLRLMPDYAPHRRIPRRISAGTIT